MAVHVQNGTAFYPNIDCEGESSLVVREPPRSQKQYNLLTQR